MKKIIVALCSLALSCAGTFGINQLVPKDQLIINQNIEQADTVQDADETEDMVGLPDDRETTEKNGNAEEKNDEVEAAAPEADNTDKEKTKKISKTEDDKAENAVKNTDKAYTNTKTSKNADKTYSNTKTDKKADTDNKKATGYNAGSGNKSVENKTNSNTVESKTNGNVKYIYKNIDLSGCNSAQEVVEKLQQNGYKNINGDNVNSISSLKDILSLIEQKNSNDRGQKNTTTNKNNTTTTANKPAATTPKETTSTKTNETASNTNNTSPAANANTSVSSYAEEVLRLVNIERSKAGLSSLSTTNTLKAAADKRAQETAVSFSHTRPDGSKFSTVLQEYGISYRTAGENIAYGQRTPQEVVNAWMNSSGHRANILNGNFNKIGIGVYQKNGVIYWSQLFTN
jgi:Cysteine-rich secretory protein family.